jgi:DNA-binding NarL/FixJ family response regulator
MLVALIDDVEVVGLASDGAEAVRLAEAGHPDVVLMDLRMPDLDLLASGLSNAEIAQRLYLSHATVKTHINRIFAKTGARDRAQAVRYAYQHGLTAS